MIYFHGQMKFGIIAIQNEPHMVVTPGCGPNHGHDNIDYAIFIEQKMFVRQFLAINMYTTCWKMIVNKSGMS
eukprot:scaffold49404_cov56-Attheya_sp.AAC.2